VLTLFRFPLLRPSLRRLDAPARRHVEVVLATPRAILAMAGVFAVFIDATLPQAGPAVPILLAVYVASSVALLFVVRSSSIAASETRLIHLTDVAWPALITTLTGGPYSPFFPVALFAIAAAAFRWGLRQALTTAVVFTCVLALQSAFWTWSPWHVAGGFPLGRLLLRTTFLYVSAILVGLLADAETQRRDEAAAGARLVDAARAAESWRLALAATLQEFLNIFEADRAEVIIINSASNAGAHWCLSRGDRELKVRDIRAADIDRELGRDTSPVFAAWRDPGRSLRVMSLSGEGGPAATSSAGDPAQFRQRECARTLLSAAFTVDADTRGTLAIVDGVIREPVADLRFLQNLVAHAAAELQSRYLIARLRSRAAAAERRKMARQLHDGITQSILALHIDLDVLRRRLDGTDPIATGIAGVQRRLKNEALTLRELIQRTKPIELPDPNFVHFLVDTVEKFRRDTAIRASLSTEVDDLVLPSRVARELGRLAQEALVNVRRHSGARQVRVELDDDGVHLALRIEDDGHGFGFTGRRAGAALNRSGAAPTTIRECARAIGATLAIESSPAGSRIEIAWTRDDDARTSRRFAVAASMSA
jgi:signal transduction histidine kinase